MIFWKKKSQSFQTFNIFKKFQANSIDSGQKNCWFLHNFSKKKKKKNQPPKQNFH